MFQILKQEAGGDVSIFMLFNALLILLMFSFTSMKIFLKNQNMGFNVTVKKYIPEIFNIETKQEIFML